ncbi:MAG TPA: hypothetical protein VN648_11650, partial [Candidatus Methylomirabilis sp.]|nr:hypothetical protein [Candidatus Methylomirabilis sp.]
MGRVRMGTRTLELVADFEAPIDSIQGSGAYKDWLMRFAEHERSDTVDLVESDKESCPVMKHATIRVPGLKVAVPLPADALPHDLVPMEGP